jgi:hypothetical protein
MADKIPSLSSMDTRQKVIAGIMVIVVLIIIWQLFGLFSGGSKPVTHSANRSTATGAPNNMNAPPSAPKPTQVTQISPQPAPVNAEDEAMLKSQQQAQQQYMTALIQLQNLRIAQSISQTNKEIAKNNYDTIVAEKKMVDLLSGGPSNAPSYNQTLSGGKQESTPQAVVSPLVNYTLVSVTQTHDIWSAVVGNQGTLYHVRIGDTLPADGSKVIAINSHSIIIEKDGEQRQLSLVSII